MNRLFAIFLLLAPLLMDSEGHGAVPRTLDDIESEHGSLQGKMELKEHTVFVFETARLEVLRETGEGLLTVFPKQADLINSAQDYSPTSYRTLKRKIARLPAHEQVRYWKLHSLRYPSSDVTSELEAALDLMETVRQESLQSAVVEVDAEPVRAYNRYRSGSNYNSYFPFYGHTSNYRHRRAQRKDSQIELDRFQRKPRPVESVTTAMSMADRERSNALATVSGARSEALSRVNGARSRSLD